MLAGAALLAVPLAAPVSAQDHVVIPEAEDCWDRVPLGTQYAVTDENGDLVTAPGTTNVLVRQCALQLGTLDDYLLEKLPEVARGFNLDIAEAIEIVQDVVGERCPVSAVLANCQDGSAPLDHYMLTGDHGDGVPNDDDVPLSCST